MLVLHICQRDDPDTGGSLRVAEALVREQRKSGIDARLLFLYGPPGHVSITHGSDVTSCLRLDSSRQAFLGVFKLAGTIREMKPDIIHSHDGINWPRLSFMCFRTPVVMHSHLPVAPSIRWAYRMLNRMTTDIIVGISLHTIETWVRAGYPASRIHCVPNGVDLDRFHSAREFEKMDVRDQLSLPRDKQLVLWVGRLHETVKGTDRVERMAALLPENMVLVVVGNGPSYDGMCDRCRALIEAGRLVMVGSTDTPELYYKAADLFLFTSYREAFGLVIIEAVASGLPLVAFPVTGGGGAVQLLEEFDTVMLSDSSSDSELHDQMQSLSVREREVAGNLEKAILAYSLSAVSNKVVDVYRIALNKYV